MRVFDFSDYKQFLFADIHAHQERKGYRTQLAEAAGCHRTYLSQILNSKVDLTLEQSLQLCRFWKFTEVETEFFMLLVQKARASTKNLREHLEGKLLQLATEQNELGARLNKPCISNEAIAMRYASSWVYPAIHMLTTVSRYQTSVAIAARLNLFVELVESVLRELEQNRLVTFDGKYWRVTEKFVHAPSEHQNANLFHRTWRSKALTQLQVRDDMALHYSAVQTLSEKDFLVLKRMVAEFLEQTRAVIEKSADEELYFFGIDTYRV